MSVKSLHSLGTVARAFDLLVTLAGGKIADVINCFQRIITDPIYRRQVWLAMTGKLVISEMTQDEWIERESNTMDQFGLPTDENRRQIERLAKSGKFGVNHYFAPAGLARKQLIELARKVGIKIDDSPYCDGRELPTEAGVLECDPFAIMVPANVEHHPFNLDAEEQEEWAKGQGGDGLTSAEEILYLLIRQFVAYGRILFMGGWIRCRNRHDGDESLDVGFAAGRGLSVDWGDRSYRDWRCGAVARKFMPLAT